MELDSNRKYGSSVINVGSMRNYNSLKHDAKPQISHNAFPGGSLERRTLMTASTNQKNGLTLLPQTDYGLHKSFPGNQAINAKVIHLLETRDGDTWTEILDKGVNRLEQYSRPVETHYLVPGVNVNRTKDASEHLQLNNNRSNLIYKPTATGLVSSIAVNSSDRSGRTLSTHAGTREAISMATLPRTSRNNHPITKRI